MRLSFFLSQTMIPNQNQETTTMTMEAVRRAPRVEKDPREEMTMMEAPQSRANTQLTDTVIVSLKFHRGVA